MTVDAPVSLLGNPSVKITRILLFLDKLIN